MQPPVGSIAMMQIDCEVTATRLVHIDKSAVPHHMINNTASFPHQQHQQRHTAEFDGRRAAWAVTDVEH